MLLKYEKALLTVSEILANQEQPERDRSIEAIESMIVKLEAEMKANQDCKGIAKIY